MIHYYGLRRAKKHMLSNSFSRFNSKVVLYLLCEAQNAGTASNSVKLLEQLLAQVENLIILWDRMYKSYKSSLNGRYYTPLIGVADFIITTWVQPTESIYLSLNKYLWIASVV